MKPIMEGIVEKGFISVDEAKQKVPEAKLKELVKKNAIAYRPSPAITADIEGVPKDPHLVARMPIERLVMKEILSDDVKGLK